MGICVSKRVTEKPSDPPANPEDDAAMVEEIQRIYAEFANNPSHDVFFSKVDTDEEHVKDRMNYSPELLAYVPEDMWKTACGSGDHFHVEMPKQGEIVVDMGSGLAMDMIIVGNIVGETGKVYGIDFTEDMLTKGAENCARAGVTNVEFINQRMDISFEHEICGTVDRVMSNGVYNLCTDKLQAFKNAYKLLKPGGHICYSDYIILPVK